MWGMMVNFMYQFDWLRDARIAAKTLCLGDCEGISGKGSHLNQWIK